MAGTTHNGSFASRKFRTFRDGSRRATSLTTFCVQQIPHRGLSTGRLSRATAGTLPNCRSPSTKLFARTDPSFTTRKPFPSSCQSRVVPGPIFNRSRSAFGTTVCPLLVTVLVISKNFFPFGLNATFFACLQSCRVRNNRFGGSVKFVIAQLMTPLAVKFVATGVH